MVLTSEIRNRADLDGTEHLFLVILVVVFASLAAGTARSSLSSYLFLLALN